jgi:mannose-6-phosphate isomerase-like protein (cupin superfamily)
MKNIRDYIESGIIETYVLGMASDGEAHEVEELSAAHPEIKEAIDTFSVLMEEQAMANAIEPDPIIKPLVLATIDFIDRMEKGEEPSFPPNLHEGSKKEDYEEWLNRADMVLPNDIEDVYAKIIGHTPEAITAIVWIKEIAPQEVHDNEYEKFLIIEGTCDITIGEEVHSLVPGDYLAIPLHVNHFVKVTSQIPCKAILQRVAA